jgi:hypothetical protein
MLTLTRFKALTDSYGAAPDRWPESVRADAEALLRASPEARQLLAEARALDEAIDAASEGENAVSWPPGEEAAALARLRAGVAAHVARAAGRQTAAHRLRWLRGWVLPVAQWSSSARRVAMAAAGGVIIAVGLLLGSMDVARPPSQVDVLAMLQPDPLPFLAEQ